jgi:hypothetical protein
MCRKIIYLLFLVLMLVLTGSLAAQDPGTANLTHLWTFEDGTADDQVGEAHGELIGDNVYVEDGDLITLPNADNVGDSWVEVPGDVIYMAEYYEVAVAAWFTPMSDYNIQWNTIWFFGNDGDGAGTGSDGMALQARRNDNHARFWFTAGAPAGYNAEDGVNDDVYGNYNYDELYHVVCQVNDASELMMYHDAELVGVAPLTTNPATGDIKGIYDISPNFGRFCHSTYAADNPWVGYLHQIAIFNRALTDEEVTYLFEHEDWSAGVTAVDKNEATALPSEYGLAQNYPNPFNPTTEISYTLKQSEQVKLTVFDVLGRAVATLVDGFQNPGKHDITFDAQDLTSGVYYYQLRTGTGTITKKMVLMK